jgi:hypothetical protein
MHLTPFLSSPAPSFSISLVLSHELPFFPCSNAQMERVYQNMLKPSQEMAFPSASQPPLSTSHIYDQIAMGRHFKY